MTPAKFDVIALLLRSGNSASSRAARMVLLGAMPPSIAARECNITPSSCSDAVTRYRETEARIDAVWKS